MNASPTLPFQDWAAENGIDLQRTRPSEPAAAPAEPPRQAPQQAAGRQSANILHVRSRHAPQTAGLGGVHGES